MLNPPPPVVRCTATGDEMCMDASCAVEVELRSRTGPRLFFSVFFQTGIRSREGT